MTSRTDILILIVEDDADSREFLELYLAAEGYRVDVASTAAEARAAIGSRRPDVILADISLPEEDGLSFVRSLRSEPSTAAIPAVALTGYSDSQTRLAATTAGFQQILAKPLDLGAVQSALETLLAAKG